MPTLSQKPRPLPAGFVACSCGVAHSPSAWSRLPLVARMADGVGGELEFRSCVCGWALVVQVAPPPPAAPAARLAVCTACGEARVAA